MIAKKIQRARFAERHLRYALNALKELHELSGDTRFAEAAELTSKAADLVSQYVQELLALPGEKRQDR